MITIKSIKESRAIIKNNSKKCSVLEYQLEDADMDLAIATITGRYPEKGYCVNLKSKELIYVLEGSGAICFENNAVNFSKGDAILISSAEKYYWDTEYCKVTITCNPAWSNAQYKLVD